jgi:hypothetical protein
MNTNRRELSERERQRQRAIKEFYRLLDEFEGSKSSSFPYSVLENLIGWLLNELEKSVERLVSVFLEELNSLRRKPRR